MTHKTTIVSAFISNINKSPDRSIDKYIENGNLILQAKIPKVIFVDEDLYDEFKERENEYTKIVKTSKDEIYLYEHIDLLTNFELFTKNPIKDTVDFMFLMSHKTEYVKKAIEMNLFDTDDYMWIDFGVKHMFRDITNQEFVGIVEDLGNRSYDKVRIASVWDINTYYSMEIYQRIVWYFAGSVFGGNKEKLCEFADRNKDLCLKIMTEENTIMWEVNIWYLLYKEHTELFDVYKCDHNNSILELY